MQSMTRFPARTPTQCARSSRHVAGRRAARIQRPLTVPNAELFDATLSNTGVSVDEDDMLSVPTLKHKLKAQRSPFAIDNNGGCGFVADQDRVILNALHYGNEDSAGATCSYGMMADDLTCLPLPAWALRAGPRETIYYNPFKVRAAIVTCGGLCPGLNDVVRQLVRSLEDYGVGMAPPGYANGSGVVSEIIGINYGLGGFFEGAAKPPTRMTTQSVDGIQLQGGTVLGTSRGGADVPQIVERLRAMNIDMLFVVGGNGGNAAANAIDEECQKQDFTCSVVGIPKSIDNDILLIDRTFGFDTSVQEGVRAILAAKVEASSALNGLGIVKLMGRQSGFISVSASMASGEVDLCIIPEIPFELPAAMDHISRVIAKKGHAVIVVAEGAAQELVGNSSSETDASGNPILQDTGLWLRDQCKAHFKQNKVNGAGADIKYIDPSYMIRSVPTIPSDKVYCQVLAQGAVHAAFAGFTGLTVGLVNTHYTYLPIPTVVQAPRIVDIRGRMWNRLLSQTKQPAWGTMESGAPVQSMCEDF